VNMPSGFTAEATLYRTSNNYWMMSTGTTSGTEPGQVVLQQASFGECVTAGRICHQECVSRGSPTDCENACQTLFVACVEGLGGDSGDTGGFGEGRPPVERCGCFLDARSSTGWLTYCCATRPGSAGQATICHVEDECPPTGCGPSVGLPGCTCISAPSGSLTCTQQCRRYVRRTFGSEAVVFPQPCIPTGTISSPPLPPYWPMAQLRPVRPDPRADEWRDSL
jgi:hypothetical protein